MPWKKMRLCHLCVQYCATFCYSPISPNKKEQDAKGIFQTEYWHVKAASVNSGNFTATICLCFIHALLALISIRAA